jgi:hypothetical protein
MPAPVHGKKVDRMRPDSFNPRVRRGERDTLFPELAANGK